MEIFRISSADKKLYVTELYSMLEEGDKEFFPPLSSRGSTTQSSLNSVVSSNGIKDYFDSMIQQEMIIAVEDGVLIGFVSYIENYETDCISSDFTPNIYISTLMVSKKGRGKGLTKKMYAFLFNDLYPDYNIFTRTWSTNVAHIKILESFDFAEHCRLRDHRGLGIDTVYYIMKR